MHDLLPCEKMQLPALENTVTQPKQLPHQKQLCLMLPSGWCSKNSGGREKTACRNISFFPFLFFPLMKCICLNKWFKKNKARDRKGQEVCELFHLEKPAECDSEMVSLELDYSKTLSAQRKVSLFELCAEMDACLFSIQKSVLESASKAENRSILGLWEVLDNVAWWGRWVFTGHGAKWAGRHNGGSSWVGGSEAAWHQAVQRKLRCFAQVCTSLAVGITAMHSLSSACGIHQAECEFCIFLWPASLKPVIKYKLTERKVFILVPSEVLASALLSRMIVYLVCKEPYALNWTDKWKALIQWHTCEFRSVRSSSGAKEQMFPWLQRDILKCFSG